MFLSYDEHTKKERYEEKKIYTEVNENKKPLVYPHFL